MHTIIGGRKMAFCRMCFEEFPLSKLGRGMRCAACNAERDRLLAGYGVERPAAPPLLFWGGVAAPDKQRIPGLGHQPDRYPRHEGEGTFDFDVVGESGYQDALSEICGGKTREGHNLECVAYLVPEPDNPHDESAIAVYIDNLKVGYLPRVVTKRVAEILAGRIISVDAVIVGGWRRPSGSEGHFGVKLDF